jgi:hypothetical protein
VFPEIGPAGKSGEVFLERQGTCQGLAVAVRNGDDEIAGRGDQPGFALLFEAYRAAGLFPVMFHAAHDVVDLRQRAVELVGIGLGLGSGRRMRIEHDGLPVAGNPVDGPDPESAAQYRGQQKPEDQDPHRAPEGLGMPGTASVS